MARNRNTTPAQGDAEPIENNEDTENAASENEAAGEENTSESSGEAVVAAQPATPAQGDLHKRLEKAVKAVHTGPQEVHYPLHKVEMLTGSLKLALPAAIDAATDEDLKSSLQAVLDLL